MTPVLSTRYSTLPALVSLISVATSKVTVPVFGFGISPRGPSTLPSAPTRRIMSGVAMTASKSVQPPLILVTTSSPPTKSAPASSASRSLSPWAITSTVFDLPSPCGKTIVPRTSWSALRGSTPSHTVNSTVSSNFANEISLTLATPPSRSYLRPSSIFSAAARYFFPCFFITNSEVQAGSLDSPPLKTIAVFQLPIANFLQAPPSRQSAIENRQV